MKEDRGERMDEKSEIRLASISRKSVKDLDEDDRAFLRARRSYLSEVQLKAFASVLSDVKTSSDGESETKPLSKMNKSELLALAHSVGIEISEDMTNEELRGRLQSTPRTPGE